MNDRRQEAIDNIISLLHERHKALLSGSRGCSFECSSIMYGALTKQMQSNALLLPRPVAPFLTWNYKKLVKTVLSFQSPQWYSLSSGHLGYSSFGSQYRHSCSNSTFASIFGKLPDSVQGLDLDIFIPSRRN